MEDTLVGFEVAKLAKELEFNILTQYGFSPDGEELSSAWKYMSNDNRSIPRPTQSLLQKWIREVHKIDVFVVACFVGDPPHKYSYYITDIKSNDTDADGSETDTYEEALEVGLQEALKLTSAENK